MPNAFSKEERVAFEDILEGFQDSLVLSRNVSVYNTDSTEMERANDTIWRPQPYIAQSFSGTDMTSNFKDFTQLAVPATLGFSKSVPWTLTAKELRDALQEGRLGDAAKQKLASDINVALMNVASQQGTLVVKRTAAASGFDDVAQADAIMNEQGVQSFDRYLALSTRDYNGMASNLAGRQTLNGKPLTAYDKAYVGMVAGFETYKLDYANRLTAAAGVTVTVNGANQYYTPKATSTAGTGETQNVDNRYQNLTIAVTSGTVKVGDCFTIAGVNAVHHITKEDTGQLKTFRVTAIVSGSGGSGVVQISPPIISGGGSTDAELEYKNVTATPANGAAITWLNTVAANVNPFWQKDALEILPGRYAVPTDAGTAVMRASTDQGIEIVMQKFYDINTMKTKYRLDTLFGVVNKQPEMSGIILFSQT
ncbi:P22 coat protein [Caudoviricetes sp.]|nr:P22 coat protein [Caudoviricetes sp.]